LDSPQTPETIEVDHPSWAHVLGDEGPDDVGDNDEGDEASAQHRTALNALVETHSEAPEPPPLAAL